ncbi:DNA repair protein RadC [Novacetimonas hansenii]|uniref:JAB domain-containing protein n=1 Tax=Novacetimonas hansenii TaxID=436 RepID=UPI00178168B2|nr:DNA repair protein RadC [Novacetimonas hansenii]QOF94594.1 DNA repair protein RadC [Novacetimonas hansenii]
MGTYAPRHDTASAPWGDAGDGGEMDDRALLRHVLCTLEPGNADIDMLLDILLARFGSAGMALSAHPHDLDAVLGTHPLLSPMIATVREAALRMHRAYVRHGDALSGHGRIVDYLQAVMAHDCTEQFRVLFLDAEYRLIEDRVMGVGTVDQAPVYPREVMRRALDLDARILILAHNHPSGDPLPSATDIQMTLHIQQVASVMGIHLHDHFVVGNGRSISFRRMGLIADDNR